MRTPTLSAEAHDEDLEQFEDLVFTKFQAVWTELDALKRLFRHLPSEDADHALLSTLQRFVTTVVVSETETTRDEFLQDMGQHFDDVLIANEPEEEEADTNVKPAAIQSLLNRPLADAEPVS